METQVEFPFFINVSKLHHFQSNPGKKNCEIGCPGTAQCGHGGFVAKSD